MISLPLVKLRWFRIASVTVILCLVVLLGTPLLARYLVQQWLLENGGEQVSFEDVDLNPFTGNLLLQRLEVKVDAETTLFFDSVGVDLDWWPLLSQQVDVQSLQLTGLNLIVDTREPEALRVGGIRLPSSAPDSEPPAKVPSAWLSGVKTLTVKDFHILIRDPKFELDVTLDYLRLTRMVQWIPQQSASLELAGRINDAPVRVSGQLTPFAEQSRYELDLSIEKLQLGAFSKLSSPPIDQLSGLLSYAGKLIFEQSGTALKLSQDGKTVLESLQVGLSEPGIETSVGQFTYDGELGFEQSDAALTLSKAGEIAVESLSLAMGAPGLKTSIGQFSHNGKLTFEQSETTLKLSQDGKTSVELLSLALTEQGLETSVGQFTYDGELGFEQSDAAITLSEAGEIAVESLSLAMRAPGLKTSIGQFSHSGKLTFEQSEAALKLSQDGKTSLELLNLALTEQGLESSVRQFTHDGELGFEQSDAALTLSEAGEIAVESLSLAMGAPGLNTSIGQFSHNGKLTFEQSETALTLGQDGKTSVELLNLALTEQGLETSVGQFTHDGELGFEQSDAALTLSEAGEIAVESLSLAMGEPGLKTSIGQFAHNGKVAFGQSGENVSLEQDGVVSLGLLDVSVRQPALDVTNSKLELTARVNYSGSPSGAEMRIASDIALENLDVKASERKVNLVSAEALRIEEFLFEAADQISIKTISSEQIQVGKVSDADAEQPQSLVRSDKLRIAGLSRAGNLVAIDSVAYEGFHNRIVRDKDGNLEVMRFIDVIENLNTPAATTEPTEQVALKKDSEEKQAEPVDLVIGSIQAAQGSSVTFIDDKVKPPFAATVIFKEISLEQLDTRKPEQNSPLRLEGSIGKHTRLSLNGDVKPFLKPLSLDLTGQIQALDLPVLSSYTWESMGLLVDSGTLDADLKLASNGELLDGKIDLVLRQLELGKVESQSGLQSKIPVPMDTALNTLRDNNNTIKLTIPIEGNINDPKFDASDAINQVMATALKTGALSYLKHALQPFGALITAAQYAGEAIAKVRLNPVEFEAGQAGLTAIGEDYLAKVANVMRERPEIDIKICGVAVQQDSMLFQGQQEQTAVSDTAAEQEQTAVSDMAAEQPADEVAPAIDEQKLTDLALLRAEGVKDYMIEQHMIPASRLVGCRPRIDTEQADAKPRTDLLI